MEESMEYIRFFEEQANKNENSSRNGPPTNNCSDGQQNGMMEKPKLKKVTRDMPKWQRDKTLKENERMKEQIKKIEEKEKEEQNKWVGLPPWKVKILKEKEVLQKQKEEEERQMRLKQEKEKQEWESLPPWKKSLLAMKGVARFKKKIEETQSTANHVTSAADSAEDRDSENSSDIPEDYGDNPEDSIGEDDIEQEQVENGLGEEGKAAGDEEPEEQVKDDNQENSLEHCHEESHKDEDAEEVEEEVKEEHKEEVEEEGKEDVEKDVEEKPEKEECEDFAEDNVEEKAEEEMKLIEVDSPTE